MSLHEYLAGREIEAMDFPFYSLIQAAMRQADSDNIERLRILFPGVWQELNARYNSPGGLLKSDPEAKRASDE